MLLLLLLVLFYFIVSSSGSIISSITVFCSVFPRFFFVFLGIVVYIALTN